MSSPLNVLIAHGTGNDPNGNWFPWLKRELESRGKTVYAPRFPTPEHQNLANWLKVAHTALIKCPPENTVLIGHSTGAVFVLRMAEQTPLPYQAVYAVCPFARDLGLSDYDPLNAGFVHPEFDWQRTKRGAKKIVCFAGDDDPYVPLSCAQDVAQNLGASLNVVEKAGHLNREAGYLQFPLLLEKICEG